MRTILLVALALVAAGVGTALVLAGGSRESTPASASVADRSGVSGTMENGVRVIPMTARRYEFTPSHLVVNVGERVKLVIQAVDTTHGFDLPDLHINVPLPQDKTTRIEFMAEDVGVHEFHCSAPCGPGNKGMKGELVILPELGPRQ